MNRPTRARAIAISITAPNDASRGWLGVLAALATAAALLLVR
jgi:hypothetical protein